MPRLADVLARLDEWYPPRHADSWDSVGLICGDPDAEVERILLAVDPTLPVAREAVETGAQLVITHHPLYLKGTSTVAANTPKGKVVHTLLTNGAALFNAHTNADSPALGVSESLALALGLTDVRPLEADPVEPRDQVVVFVPADAAEAVWDAMAAAGAGAIGDYDSCSWSTEGAGRFRPLDGANPTLGRVGEVEDVAETRVEMVLPRRRREAVRAALVAAHPYEEPAFHFIEIGATDEPARGSGRIGRIEPITLRAFAEQVAEALPATAHGVRVAGDPDQVVETVALCGGAGDFLLDRARSAGADAYLTSDLRHHPASECREAGPEMALLDVAHWAAEWTWLPVLRKRLVEAWGDTVAVDVSTTPTDPWTFRV